MNLYSFPLHLRRSILIFSSLNFKIITKMASFTSVNDTGYYMVGVRAPSIGFILNLSLGK